MHGNVSRSRKRKRRPAKTTDGWLTPQQQIEEALEILQPTPEDREACTSDITIALHMVRAAKEAEAKTEAENKPVRKKDWDTAIKKLQAVEYIAKRSPRLINEKVVDAVRSERAFLEAFGLPLVREIPFEKRSRYAAADHAWCLLGFGLVGPTGLTEGGIWHQLAAVLFGYATTYDFNFDYIRRMHRRTYLARRRKPKQQKV